MYSQPTLTSGDGVSLKIRKGTLIIAQKEQQILFSKERETEHYSEKGNRIIGSLDVEGNCMQP